MGRKRNVRNDLIPFKRLFIFIIIFLLLASYPAPPVSGARLSVDPIVKYELNKGIRCSSISSDGEYLAVGGGTWCS